MSVLRLNSNEGPRAPQELLAELAALDPEVLRRYPDATAVETALAARAGVSAERVVVTAGADEALDRIFRSYSGPDRPVLLPEPTFDMLERFAALAGAPVVRVPWLTDAFPLAEILARLDNRTAIVVIVSPNNPTGGVASGVDVRRIAAAAPQSLVLIDQAYIEYADEGIDRGVLDLANVVVVRTMSKAWGRAGLETSLRITLPGDPADFERLTTALDVVLAPEAIVFDLDGVLADVRASQRAAMVETAATYGVTVTMSDIEAALRTGDAANDWIVTQRLITARGMQADLETVTARFQALYLGTPDSAGLREHERLIVPRAVLARLADRLPLAVVTGRPRDEARWFLERVEITDLFQMVVCMEDAARKPDPAPVRLALERLGVRRAWMVGNTPDDIRAAAGADVVPLGVVAPGDDLTATAAALTGAGAARVLDRMADLEELLP